MKTMASFASTEATWTKTMASFAFVRHHRWSTLAAWTNNDQLRFHRNRLDQKVNENNGQLRFRLLPWVEHASCLEQHTGSLKHN